MRDSVTSILAHLFALAFFLAGGIVSTFYTRWLQRVMVARYSSPGMLQFMRRVYQSSYFIWETRVAGIGALVAAAVTLWALVRSLARLVLSGR